MRIDLSNPRLRFAISLASCAGVAASLTIFVLGLWALAAVGGRCSDGGYIGAAHCPNGVLLLTPALFGWLLLSASFAWASGVGEVATLSLAAFMGSISVTTLVLTLQSLDKRGSWAGFAMSLMFGAFAAAPLVIAVRGLRERLRGDAPATQPAPATVDEKRPATNFPTKPVLERRGPLHGYALIAELEKLGGLHHRGDLTDEEYAAAKRDILGEGSK